MQLEVRSVNREQTVAYVLSQYGFLDFLSKRYILWATFD
ncbi:MAG: hypothetical protein UX04_C0007G0032 [Microgenomates group bacterium GW2011_GWF2_45_18]|nr:MAG: hypothetical protein UX04_C0007G0032 [Microgenomates group bacterium GW2011_GWF2_45_18]